MPNLIEPSAGLVRASMSDDDPIGVSPQPGGVVVLHTGPRSAAVGHTLHDRQIAGEPGLSASNDRVITNREDAGNVLCELFLANAARGDNAANDELVDAMVRRLRALRVSTDGDR